MSKSYGEYGSTQAEAIEMLIEDCFTKGMENKSEIFTLVENTLKVPRPTVRRVASNLRKKYSHLVECLEKKHPSEVRK